MDCSPPGSSVHGILQARILSGLQCPSPGGLPDPGIEPGSSALPADSFPPEPPGKHTYIKSLKILVCTKQKAFLQNIHLLLAGRLPGGSDGKESASMQETQV